MTVAYVVDLDRIDRTDVSRVGAKAVNLGELMRIDGIHVPAGFCVTTDAYERAVQGAPAVDDLVVPPDVAAAIVAAVESSGDGTAFAVRSSATAEDLPGASFAGQYDSYLDVVGADAVVEHVRRCWESLFDERAIAYRRHNGFDDHAVRIAVIVQRMARATAAGVLFTADPVTSNRKLATVEAVRGLGESFVSGTERADAYTVRADETVTTVTAQTPSVLTDEQVVRLVRAGRRIEAHFGHPQDIEWCLVGEDLEFVQSRPITTLFPVPDCDDGETHIYLSVGHQQMMTDAMKPLGLSVWHLTTSAVMTDAGGRLFVDVTPRLAAPTGRDALLAMMRRSDPLTFDALQTLLARDGVVRPRPDGPPPTPLLDATAAPIETDPTIVGDLIERSETALATLRRDIDAATGPELFDVMLASFEDDKRLLFDPQSMAVIKAGMDATWWLNDRLEEWLGERNAADTLTLSAPNNVTSEMGLALLDVADAIRPHPQVVEFLRAVEEGDDVLDGLGRLAGGVEARDAVRAYLDRYGMRCAGEIDITRPRWSERLTDLVPAILTDVDNFTPGAGERRVADGLRRAHDKESELLTRLRALPDGETKARETARMIERVRTFVGYREYPKYNRIRRAFVYKQALLRTADQLVRTGVLAEPDDAFYLTFDELHDLVRHGTAAAALAGIVRNRRAKFRRFETLSPPRVLTSDGEVLAGEYRRDDAPPGALPGLAVSAGIVEGRARVVTDMAHADLEAGDVLVTAYTDPSWTPLFLTAAAVVTEVGGLMTHGAVIAREYGLPGVVGVDRATHLIRDRQRIRVDGSNGFVVLLDDDQSTASMNR